MSLKTDERPEHLANGDHSPAQAEWDSLVNQPDMQKLDALGDSIASDYSDDTDDGSGGSSMFDRAHDRASDSIDRRHAATAERQAAEKKEWDDAERHTGKSKSKDQDKGGRLNKKNALRFGGAGIMIGMAVSIFGLITPFKLPALLQTITDATGQRVEQITVHRAKVILAHAVLTKFGSPGGVVITGQGPVSSLIASMRTNKFEDKLKAKGIEIVDANKEGVRLKVNDNFVANGSRLKSANLIVAAFDENQVTNKILTEMVKEEIPSWRWMKRAKFASWLRLKYKISHFGVKESTETDRDKKLADIQEDRLTNDYTHYADDMSEAVGCIMGDAGCAVEAKDKDTVLDKVKARASAANATKEAIKTTIKEETRAIVSNATKNITAKIHTELIKTLTSKFAVKAIPIIGWIDLVATIDHIAFEVGDNDYMAKIPSYYRASSFGYAYATWAGYADQQKAGELDNDFAGVLSAQLDGAEESQAFSYINGYPDKGTPVKVKVDENNPSAINGIWNTFKASPTSLYYRYVTHNALNIYYETIGGGGLLGALGDALGGMIGAGLSIITPSKLEEFFGKFISEMMGKIAALIGFAADPLAVGPDLFNNLYAGGDVAYNSFCKEAGCRELSDTQVAVQNKTIAVERNQEIQSKGLSYALFSPESPKSVTNRLAMVIPSELGPNNFNFSAGVGQMADIVMGTPGRLFGATTKASPGYVNLNGLINYGALASDLDNPVAPESISGDACPEVTVGGYDNCKIDKLVAESMACNFDSESPGCDFTSADGANTGTDDPSTSPGEVTASGFAWPLGEANWGSHRNNHLASHYDGGGFLGSSYSNSVDISWGGIKGTAVYAILGGTVNQQPLGRSSHQCHGNPNGNDNGGMMITSSVGGHTVKIAYAHGDQVLTPNGSTVNAGDRIMSVGNVGNSCGAHLHMNISVDSKNICPQDLFVAMDKGGNIDLLGLASKATPTCAGRG